MWNVEFASGVRSVATGRWSVHGVDSNVCSVWFSLVVFRMLNVKCNVGRFVPNVKCGVCSAKCRVCSLMGCVECGGRLEVGMWNVEFASGVRSVATGGWSAHGVDCNVCSVRFSLVVFSMLNVKCNVGRFGPNVRCGVCSVKC